MGKPLVGEVVVLPFPQTNLQSGKRRPALVVADLIGDDLILCQITSQSRSDGYSVPLAVADFERGRLAVDSFIRPNRLFTIEQSVILYAAGKVKDAQIARSSRQSLRPVFLKLFGYTLAFSSTLAHFAVKEV
jgi:mRNA interferase MazF